MEITFPSAAALDIGKRTTMACIQTPKHKELRSFPMIEARSSGAGRLAPSAQGHARGHGVDGRLLEAHLQSLGELRL